LKPLSCNSITLLRRGLRGKVPSIISCAKQWNLPTLDASITCWPCENRSRDRIIPILSEKLSLVMGIFGAVQSQFVSKNRHPSGSTVIAITARRIPILTVRHVQRTHKRTFCTSLPTMIHLDVCNKSEFSFHEMTKSDDPRPPSSTLVRPISSL
jgi:hypothetical protein